MNDKVKYKGSTSSSLMTDIINERRSPTSDGIVSQGNANPNTYIGNFFTNLNSVFFQEGVYDPTVSGTMELNDIYRSDNNSETIRNYNLGTIARIDKTLAKHSMETLEKYGDINVFTESAVQTDKSIKEGVTEALLDAMKIPLNNINADTVNKNEFYNNFFGKDSWRIKLIEHTVDMAMNPNYTFSKLATPTADNNEANFEFFTKDLVNNINQGIRDHYNSIPNASVKVDDKKEFISIRNLTQTGSDGKISYTDINNYAMEGFDPQYLGSMGKLSITLAFGICGSDKFTEALFPIFPIPATQKGFEVEIPVLSFVNRYSRKMDGSPVTEADENKIPLLKAIFEEDLWTVNYLAIDPILKTGVVDSRGKPISGTNQYLFEAAAFKSTVGGNYHNSAPLLIGNEVDYLALCADSVNLNGQYDYTDTLERAPELKTVYLRIGSGAEAEFYSINMLASQLGAGTFETPNASTKMQSISFTTDTYSIILNSNTKQVNTTETRKVEDVSTYYIPSKLLDKIGLESNSNYSVRLELNIKIDFNMNNANVRVGDDSTSVRVKEIFNNTTGEIVNRNDPNYVKIMNYFVNDPDKKIRLWAVDLNAQVTNSNKRILGNSVTIDVYKANITIPFNSGFSVEGPEDAMHYRGDDSDIKNVPELVTLINQKIFHEQYKVLFEYKESLKQIYQYSSNPFSVKSHLGIGSYYLVPYYKETDLNIPAMVDSFRSSERLEDIRSALFHVIRIEAINMLMKSHYYNAMRILKNNNQTKATLVLGTDLFIGSVLCASAANQFTESDRIPLTLDIDMKIVTSPHDRMINKIIGVFCDLDGDRHNEINPLQFGNTFVTPPIVYPGTKQLGSNKIRYINSIARFKPNINTPIMTVFNVKGITSVFGRQDHYINTNIKELTKYTEIIDNQPVEKEWDIMSGVIERYKGGGATEESFTRFKEAKNKVQRYISRDMGPSMMTVQSFGTTAEQYDNAMSTARNTQAGSAPAASSDGED